MSEWIELVEQAKSQGISKEELLGWLETVKSRTDNTAQ